MEEYYKKLINFNFITLRKYADWCSPVHWMMTVIFDNKFNRDDFISYMKGNNIDCRQMINPVHKAAHFLDHYSENFLISDNISKQSVHLPSGTALSIEDMDIVVNNLQNYFTASRNS